MPVSNPIGKYTGMFLISQNILTKSIIVRMKEAEVVETQVLLKKEDYL